MLSLMPRVPDLSPQAQSSFRSIVGHLPCTLGSADVTPEQADQLLAVLEAELGGVRDEHPAALTKRREISELAAVLLLGATPVPASPSPQGPMKQKPI